MNVLAMILRPPDDGGWSMIGLLLFWAMRNTR
jgi:hypothetical protein